MENRTSWRMCCKLRKSEWNYRIDKMCGQNQRLSWKSAKFTDEFKTADVKHATFLQFLGIAPRYSALCADSTFQMSISNLTEFRRSSLIVSLGTTRVKWRASQNAQFKTNDKTIKFGKLTESHRGRKLSACCLCAAKKCVQKEARADKGFWTLPSRNAF